MSLVDRSRPSGYSAVSPGNSPVFLPPWFSEGEARPARVGSLVWNLSIRPAVQGPEAARAATTGTSLKYSS